MQREREADAFPTVNELLGQGVHSCTPIQFLYLPEAQGPHVAPLSAKWLRRPPPST